MKMILLRNFNNAFQYFDFDSKKYIKKESISNINGWYMLIDNVFSGLLVLDSTLYFLWENEQFIVNDNLKVEIDRNYSQNKSLFKLLSFDRIIVQFAYETPKNLLNTSPFEYIDEDDFNWGEYLASIINNLDKKKQFLENLMSS
ncbi:hypothetical protein [Emticicia sp. C21]|uniref:hypothetical protein n=1 Tax=Emticicia sp. C21 TaxID=2302915 RepID=UPI000E342695|nr:hypothetical protein [Emticicia sp. C21]RFS15040.1 hypothetical protein D0T08_18350 [Emticicia sp. C21]